MKNTNTNKNIFIGTFSRRTQVNKIIELTSGENHIKLIIFQRLFIPNKRLISTPLFLASAN